MYFVKIILNVIMPKWQTHEFNIKAENVKILKEFNATILNILVFCILKTFESCITICIIWEHPMLDAGTMYVIALRFSMLEKVYEIDSAFETTKMSNQWFVCLNFVRTWQFMVKARFCSPTLCLAIGGMDSAVHSPWYMEVLA